MGVMAVARLAIGSRIGRAAAAVALVALIAGCESAPVTGRSQLILLPESQDAELNRRVQEVGQRIAAVSGQPDWDWQFTVFDNPEPNAFALPGGKVGVYTGLFKVAENDAQLATVMGHEVGHAIARHGAERMSQGLLTQLGTAALGVAAGPAYADLAAQAATLGVILPYSRTQESEADEIGLMLMAEAGFDPRESVKLWQNFEALGGERPPEFLSTHPAEGTRIKRLQALMPKAMEIYESRAQS